MRLSIASSSFGSTPSASIIALTPESDIISAIVGSRCQFELPGWIAACAASIRLGDETAGLSNRNVGFFTEDLFSTHSCHSTTSRKLPASMLQFSKKNRSDLNLGLERFASA